MLYKDRHGNNSKDGKPDVNPSKFLEFLANFGCLGEVALGPLCLFFPEYGFPITCIFHGYILSMTPFASVMEWNVFCIYMSYSMFGNVGISSGYTGYTLSSVVSSYLGLPLYLLMFLTFVLLMVPIYGQIYPKRVPFLVAFRPYAGNWRFSWHMVAKSAQNKMRKLKTLEVRNKNKKKIKIESSRAETLVLNLQNFGQILYIYSLGYFIFAIFSKSKFRVSALDGSIVKISKFLKKNIFLTHFIIVYLLSIYYLLFIVSNPFYYFLFIIIIYVLFLQPVFIEEGAKFLWGGNPHFCSQFTDYFSGNMVFFPHFRPLIPMIEKLEKKMGWKTDDYKTLFNEVFLNAVCGWTLGTGYYVNKPFLNALTSTCGFVKGECFVAVFEPHGLFDHTSEWHLVDVTEPDVKIYHGKMPYAELENMQPCDMTVDMFDQHSILKTNESKSK